MPSGLIIDSPSQRLRAHPAVAVPLGAALAQADAVHHAVPGEPVPRRLAGQRVGAVAQVAAGELGRERAVDREVDGVDLVRHRGEVPGHVDRLRRSSWEKHARAVVDMSRMTCRDRQVRVRPCRCRTPCSACSPSPRAPATSSPRRSRATSAATPGRPGTRASTRSWPGWPSDGLIEVTHEGARGSRTYAVTDAGREELRTWLLTPPAAGAKVRNELVLRMFLLSALEPGRRPQAARHGSRRTPRRRPPSCAELREEAGPVRLGPEGFGQLAAEYGLRQYDAVHDWALWAIDQLDQADQAVTASDERAQRDVARGRQHPARGQVRPPQRRAGHPEPDDARRDHPHPRPEAGWWRDGAHEREHHDGVDGRPHERGPVGGGQAPGRPGAQQQHDDRVRADHPYDRGDHRAPPGCAATSEGPPADRVPAAITAYRPAAGAGRSPPGSCRRARRPPTAPPRRRPPAGRRRGTT